MPALIEAHTHPDWPGVTQYEITANKPDDVQTAITAIMGAVEDTGGQAAFDNPHRGYSIKDGAKLWRSTGKVMMPENPTAAALADVRAYQRNRLAVVR